MPNQYRQLVADLLLFYRNSTTLNPKPDPNLLINKLSGWGSNQTEIESNWLHYCFVSYHRPSWCHIANTILALNALKSHPAANKGAAPAIIDPHINALANTIVAISKSGSHDKQQPNDAATFQQFVQENDPSTWHANYSNCTISMLIELLKYMLNQCDLSTALKAINQDHSGFLRTLIFEELGFEDKVLTTEDLQAFRQYQIKLDDIIKLMLDAHSKGKLTPNLSKTIAMLLENSHISVCLGANETDIPNRLMLHYHANTHEFWLHHNNIATIQSIFTQISLSNNETSAVVKQWQTAITTYHESAFDPVIITPQDEKLVLIEFVNLIQTNHRLPTPSSPVSPRSPYPIERPHSAPNSRSGTLPRNLSFSMFRSATLANPINQKEIRFLAILEELGSATTTVAKAPLQFLKEIVACALESRGFSINLSQNLNKYPTTNSGDIALNLLNYGRGRYPNTSPPHYGDCYYRHFRLMMCRELRIPDQILTSAHLHAFAQTTLFLTRKQQELTENLSRCIAGLGSFAELKTIVIASPCKELIEAEFRKKCNEESDIVKSLVALAHAIKTSNPTCNIGPIIWWLNLLETINLDSILPVYLLEVDYVCSQANPDITNLETVGNKLSNLRSHSMTHKTEATLQKNLRQQSLHNNSVLENLLKLVELCERDAETHIYCPTILWWTFMFPGCLELTIGKLIEELTRTMAPTSNPSTEEITLLARRFANLKYATMKTSYEEQIQKLFQQKCNENSDIAPALQKLYSACLSYESTRSYPTLVLWWMFLSNKIEIKFIITKLIEYVMALHGHEDDKTWVSVFIECAHNCKDIIFTLINPEKKPITNTDDALSKTRECLWNNYFFEKKDNHIHVKDAWIAFMALQMKVSECASGNYTIEAGSFIITYWCQAIETFFVSKPASTYTDDKKTTILMTSHELDTYKI